MQRLNPGWTPSFRADSIDDFGFGFEIDVKVANRQANSIVYYIHPEVVNMPTLVETFIFDPVTEAVLASSSSNSLSGAGIWFEIPFAGPFVFDIGQYICYCFTDGDYGHTGSTLPETDGIDILQGCYGFGHFFPTTFWGDQHGLDLIFSEGAVMEPVLSGSGSLADQIMAGLISQGFTTGTIMDRERARLLSKLVLVEPQNLSIQDLYSQANEPNRLLGLV